MICADDQQLLGEWIRFRLRWRFPAPGDFGLPGHHYEGKSKVNHLIEDGYLWVFVVQLDDGLSLSAHLLRRDIVVLVGRLGIHTGEHHKYYKD